MSTGDDAVPSAGAETVDAADARAAMERVLASDAFRGSPQLAAFLRFVVTETLEGRAEQIKGYTIATEALGRPDDFDPQTDPIVRVEAIRLRRLLASYYDGAAGSDPVRITIPRGAYVPQFTRIGPPEATVAPPAPSADKPTPPAGGLPATPVATQTVVASVRVTHDGKDGRRSRWGPVVAGLTAVVALLAVTILWLAFPRPASAPPPQVAEVPSTPTTPPLSATAPTTMALDLSVDRQATLSVVRFNNLSTTTEGASAGARLTERLIDALARFDEIRVVVPDAARGALPAAGAPVFGFQGSVELRFGQVVFSARLVNERSGEVVWSRQVNFSAEGVARGREEDAVVRSIATAIAQPYGVISSASLRELSSRPVPSAPFYACLLSAFEYWRTYSPADHARARSCLEAGVQAEPTFAEGFAFLTYFHLDEYRFGYNRRDFIDPLDAALRSAQRAIELRPQSARSLQALCGAHFVRGEGALGIPFCEQARQINPFDTDIAADLGVKYIIDGDARRGLDLLEEALFFNPARPIWYDFFGVLGAYISNDLPTAAIRMRQIQRPDYPLAHLARALVFEATGRMDEARAAARDLVRMQPAYARGTIDALRRQFPNEALVSRLAAVLARLGLPERV